MNGLEVLALIAGIVGAAAGSASAYKDMKRKGGEQPLYKSEQIVQVSAQQARSMF